MSQPNCVRTPVILPLLLGELTLRRASFAGLRIAGNVFGDGGNAPIPLDVLTGLDADVDVVHLASWPLPSGTRPPKVKGFHCYIPRRYRRFFIDLRMPFSSYMEKFSSKSRSTLHRKLRKYTQASGGTLTFVDFSKETDILRFHQLARQVSRLTYQESLLQAGMPDGDAFRDSLVQMSRNDQVRGYILYHHSQPAAYLYCPVVNDIVQYEHVGFDPQYGSLSPGTVLFFSAIQRLFEERTFTAFDFTEGEGDHKAFFANHCVDCADIYYLRHTAYTHATVLSHALCTSASHVAGACLARLGLKRAVTRFLRRASAQR